MAAAPQIEIILNRIRKYRADHSIAYRALADAANLSPAALNGMDSPDWNPRAETIEALEGVIARGWKPERATRKRAA
jgi:transcriptional regulator with XRE-family HTH domain